jgi:hypothetical protein
MAQPVWTLSVDLQTKTAAFSTGLADAARSARGSFQDIKEGAREMSDGVRGASGQVNYSMMEARHSVMMLGEEVGIHLPRSLTMFIASLGPIGPALEAAFPWLAVILGATLLIEHLSKLKENGDKTAEAWKHIETEGTHALNKMGDELLQVEAQSDRLSGNSLAALQKQLLLIDHQSMSELESTFDALASKIDTVLKAGSRGTLLSTLIGEGAANKVQAEFDKFKDQYDSLLSQRKDTEARGALVDEIIRAQKQLEKYQAMPQTNSWVREAVGDYAHLITQLENMNRLQDESSAINSRKKDNVKSEHMEDLHPELFVDAENKKRVSLAETMALMKKEQEAANAADKLKLEGMEALDRGLKEIARDNAKLANEAAKEDAGHGSKMAELQLAANKEAGQMRIAQGRMTLQEISDMEMGFAAQEYNAKKQALQKEIAALEGNGAEVENKKRTLNNRLLELDKQFHNQDQALEDQAAKKQLASAEMLKQRLSSEYAQGFTQWITGKQSFSQMMASIDEKMLEQAITSQLQYILRKGVIQEMERFGDARTAAANAYAQSGGNPIIGSIDAAIAFASVMGMEEGGIVPGVGRGDIVPARLEPGEAVLNKRLTEQLTNFAKFGQSDSGGDTHIHHHATYNVQAFDSNGVDRVLQTHGDKFVQLATNHIRKMNR